MRYAAYGSNLHPVRLRQRVPSAELVGSAMVAGWRLAFRKRGRDGSGKCDIVEGSGSVLFAVFEIDDPEVILLHKAEGLGFGYEKAWLDLPDAGRCFTYRACETHIDAELAPYSWYIALVIAGLQHHSAPADYLARVEAVPCQRDPDSMRHDTHMQIVRAAHAASGLDASQRDGLT